VIKKAEQGLHVQRNKAKALERCLRHHIVGGEYMMLENYGY